MPGLPSNHTLMRQNRPYSLSVKRDWLDSEPVKKLVDSPTTMFVLQTIVYKYVNSDSGLCWPSRSTLMKDTRLSLSTVKKALKELRDKKLLIITDQQDFKSTTYKLNLNINRVSSEIDCKEKLHPLKLKNKAMLKKKVYG